VAHDEQLRRRPPGHRPPDGQTPTTRILDARGNLTELRQYKGNSPTGDYDKTTYTYTPRNQLASVTDPAGNVWR